MQFILSLLPIVQVILAVLLITAILLQARGSSVGGAFGGGDGGSTFYTRRGGEKVLFNATIVIGILYAIAAFVTILL
ncbi:MAG: preprotein translocase subunit SecG [Candidatus Pacebacteria bacterium]|nr:preprotein translocase subunit SecG [Candidatus Paceibacterota bacterium]